MALRRFLANLAIVAAVATGFGGCFLDRSGIVSPATLTVEPALFCPADPVEVRWDASGVPRNPAFCAALGRDYREPIACTSNAGCPSGGVCYDEYCCPPGYEGNRAACPRASGCVAPFDLTVTGDPEAIDPPVHETTQIRGSRTVTPEASTTYTLNLTYTGASEPYQATSLARMVTVDPPTGTRTFFSFVCAGTTPGYTRLDMDSPRFATEHVQIAGVRNVGRHAMLLGGGSPERPPVTLAPGQSTDLLNGEARGVWQARLAPTDPAALLRPRCTATGVEGAWPDLEVEWTFVCAIDP